MAEEGKTIVTYTRTRVHDADAGFPECLVIVPQREDIPRTYRQFYVAHNVAVHAFIRDRMGAQNDLRRTERAILSLAAGIEQFVGSHGFRADVDYYAAEIVGSLLDTFTDALKYDLGRLDGAALSEWAEKVRADVMGDES